MKRSSCLCACLLVLCLTQVLVIDARRSYYSSPSERVSSRLRSEMRHTDSAYLELLDRIHSDGDTLAATPLSPLDSDLSECHPQQPQLAQQCQNSVASFTDDTLGFGGRRRGMSIEEALDGVKQWLDEFQRKIGPGQSLWLAAHAAVEPLLTRLKRTQHHAVENLIDSNDAIIQHVEEVATQHIFDLLRAAGQRQDQVDNRRKRYEKNKEIQEQIEQQRMQIKNDIASVQNLGSHNSTVDPNALSQATKEEKKLEHDVKVALGV
jgi:hypothetical protein